MNTATDTLKQLMQQAYDDGVKYGKQRLWSPETREAYQKAKAEITGEAPAADKHQTCTKIEAAWNPDTIVGDPTPCARCNMAAWSLHERDGKLFCFNCLTCLQENPALSSPALEPKVAMDIGDKVLVEAEFRGYGCLETVDGHFAFVKLAGQQGDTEHACDPSSLRPSFSPTPKPSEISENRLKKADLVPTPSGYESSQHRFLIDQLISVAGDLEECGWDGYSKIVRKAYETLLSSLRPAPSGGDGVAEWMTDEWKDEFGKLCVKYREAFNSPREYAPVFYEMVDFIARTAPAPMSGAVTASKGVVEEITEKFYQIIQSLNDGQLTQTIAEREFAEALAKIVELPEPSEWDLDWNEYIKAERDDVTIKPYHLDWKTIDLNREQALQFAAALIEAAAKEGK